MIQYHVLSAICAKCNNLLHLPGWKQFKRLARKHEDFKQLVYKATIKYKFRTAKLKYGYQVPNTHFDAVLLDDKASSNLWKESKQAEINALNEYKVFKDIVQVEYHQATIRKYVVIWFMTYDIKHDGRHKSCLVAGGHLAPEPKESTYSGEVFLRPLRLITFIAELNHLQL
jgi:hypothetical protein